MKNGILIAFFLLLQSAAHTQTEFGSIGSTWTYTENRPTVPPPGSYWPYVLESESEVSIQGRVCKKLVGGQGFPEETIYISTEGDSVLWWNADKQQFYLLYDFSAQPGDSWDIDMWPSVDQFEMSIFTVHVDSTGYEIWNNDSLKVWHLSFSGYGVYWDVRYLEKVGNPCFFTPVPGNFDRPICGLRCFESEEDEYNFVDYPCDSIFQIVTVDVAEPEDMEAAHFFPNPTSGWVSMEYATHKNEWIKLELFDLTGIRVRSEDFYNEGTCKFDVSALASGVYSMRLMNTKKVLLTDKWVIIK